MGKFAIFSIGTILALTIISTSGCGDNSKKVDDAAKIARLEERAKNLKKENKATNRELRRKERKIASLEKKLGKKSSGPTSSSGSTSGSSSEQTSGSKSCGGSLSVGSNTTCSFAENVRTAYFDAGGGDVTVSVYSPATNRFYSMSCRGGAPTVCTGGNNASVYIR